MKNVKLIIILFLFIIITGCASKFEGTWCKYSDVATSLVILNENISDDNLNKITDYLKTIDDIKSYDVIDKIEDSSKMITIYYKNEDNIEKYEQELKKYSDINSIKSFKQNAVVDELIIKNDSYVYDKSLTTLDAYEYKGNYKINKNIIELDNNFKFYYKDKFLCYDEYCNEILTKSKKSTCMDR